MWNSKKSLQCLLVLLLALPAMAGYVAHPYLHSHFDCEEVEAHCGEEDNSSHESFHAVEFDFCPLCSIAKHSDVQKPVIQSDKVCLQRSEVLPNSIDFNFQDSILCGLFFRGPPLV